MLKALFGDVARGRIDGLAYLGYTVLLTLALFALVFVLSLVLSGVGGIRPPDAPADGAPPANASAPAQGPVAPAPGPETDLPATAPRSRAGSASSPLAMLFAIPTVAVYFFAVANLVAKRVRDMGLPGWPGVGLLAVLGGAIGATLSGTVAAGFHLLVSLGLILVPTDTFRRPGSDAREPGKIGR